MRATAPRASTDGCLDAVLALAGGDLERALLLFRSLEVFFEPLGTCYVVTPDRDADFVRRRLPPGPYVVVPESEIVPEIGYFWSVARLRAKLRLVGPPIHGWYVQQLVKLSVAERVATPFYLTLDADVLCVRPTGYNDLVRDGRAIVQTTPPNHPEWNDDAERVLALPRSGRQYGVTPAVLSRDAALELASYLEGRVDRRMRRFAENLPPGRVRDVVGSWRSFLFRNLPWTEYALYHTFLERTNRFDAYHVNGGVDVLYGNCVWMESEFESWDLTASDGDVAAPPFSIVQSATRIPPAAIRAKIESYLTTRAVPA